MTAVGGPLELLCHRGLWQHSGERNTLAAFRAAWDAGWGIETDLRDDRGRVVISHDPARGDELTLDDLLIEHARRGRQTLLALNVKADGLAAAVAAAIAAHGTPRCFVFDMSVPDMFAWADAGVALYTRWSDVEPDPVLLDRSTGLWLDGMERDWWAVESVRARLAEGSSVAVVSPELHGRDPGTVWPRVADLAVDPRRTGSLFLCTDRPYDAVKEVGGA